MLPTAVAVAALVSSSLGEIDAVPTRARLATLTCEPLCLSLARAARAGSSQETPRRVLGSRFTVPLSASVKPLGSADEPGWTPPEPAGDRERLGYRIELMRSLRQQTLGFHAAAEGLPRPRNNPPAYISGSEEFDQVDMSLEWEAYRSGPLAVTVLGGVRGIKARYQEIGPAGVDESTITLVPTAGAGVSLNLSRSVALGFEAAAHAMQADASVVDLTAEARIGLLPGVDLKAGYQYLRSDLEAGPVSMSLDERGVFAKLQIRF